MATIQSLIDQWRLHPDPEVGSCANQLAGWLRTQEEMILISVDEYERLKAVEEAGARLPALVATWRAEADAEDARLKQYCYGGDHDGDMLDEDLSRGLTVNARMRRCADELDAMLSARRG